MSEEQVSTPILVTPREAARLLSISERSLHAWTKAGLIPRVRIGKSVRYSLQSLKEFSEKSEKGY
jgi:excisionase family DNA binding protein